MLRKRIYQLFVMFALSLCSSIVTAGVHAQFDSFDATSHLSQTQATSHHDDNSGDKNDDNAVVDVEGLDEDGNTLFNGDAPPAFSSIRRIASEGKFEGRNFEPNYFLLVAFLAPPLLERAMTSTEIPNASIHWTSHIASSSRLSGWKESNLIYSQLHSRHS